jgi:hypothetical protein
MSIYTLASTGFRLQSLHTLHSSRACRGSSCRPRARAAPSKGRSDPIIAPAWATQSQRHSCARARTSFSSALSSLAVSADVYLRGRPPTAGASPACPVPAGAVLADAAASAPAGVERKARRNDAASASDTAVDAVAVHSGSIVDDAAGVGRPRPAGASAPHFCRSGNCSSVTLLVNARPGTRGTALPV